MVNVHKIRETLVIQSDSILFSAMVHLSHNESFVHQKSDGSLYLVCTASSFINVGTLLLTYCTVRIRDALLLYSMYSMSTVMYPYSLASTSALLLVGSG